MKKIIKILLTVVAIVGLFLMYVQFTYQQEFKAPVIGIRAKSDSTTIARGKYLVLGPAHCPNCHTTSKGFLAGGHEFKTPPATFYTPNITSDATTGIGRYTDEQLAQVLRNGIKPNKHAMAPFMEYHNVSDEDLTAIISYLRSTKPIQHRVQEHEVNMIGKIITRFILKPAIPVKRPPVSVKQDTTSEYGRYMISIANCKICHTQKSQFTGELISQPLSGGSPIENPTGTYTPPNLTPDPKTGRISEWTEQMFISRFKMGMVIPNSPMPWESFSKISENDLKAIYKYLKSLPPTQNKIESTFIPKKSTKT